MSVFKTDKDTAKLYNQCFRPKYNHKIKTLVQE